MALAVDLYNSTVTLSLSDDTALGIVWGGSLGTPGANRINSRSWGRGYTPLAAIDYRERTISLTIHVTATTQDNWITTFRQIQQLLLDVRTYYTTNGADGDKAVLSVQLNGQTYPLEYDVLDGELNAAGVFEPAMQSITAPALRNATLTLQVKPFGRTQQLSRTVSGNLANGGGVTSTNPGFAIASPNGDVASPMRLTFQSAAGDGFGRVMIGKKTNITTAQFPFAVNLEVSTAPGYTVTEGTSTPVITTTDVAVAGAHNGNVGRIGFATGVATTTGAAIVWRNIEITSGVENWRGLYRVYARVDALRNATGGATGIVLSHWFSYGGSSGDAIVLASVPQPTATADYLVDLGVAEFPPRFSPLDSPQQPLKMRYGSYLSTMNLNTTGSLDLDCLFFMPIGEGFFDGVLSSPATAQTQVVVDKLQLHPQAYALDSSGALTSANRSISPYTNTFFDITPNVNNVFYALYTCSTGTMTHDLTDVYTLTGEFYPNYAQGRTSAS